MATIAAILTSVFGGGGGAATAGAGAASGAGAAAAGGSAVGTAGGIAGAGTAGGATGGLGALGNSILEGAKAVGATGLNSLSGAVDTVSEALTGLPGPGKILSKLIQPGITGQQGMPPLIDAGAGPSVNLAPGATPYAGGPYASVAPQLPESLGSRIAGGFGDFGRGVINPMTYFDVGSQLAQGSNPGIGRLAAFWLQKQIADEINRKAGSAGQPLLNFLGNTLGR